MPENRDKNIRVNFHSDEPFSTPLSGERASTPLSNRTPNLPANAQVAQEAIESLRNLPGDLGKIAASMERANSARKSILIASLLIAAVIAAGGYYIINERVKTSLAQNSVQQMRSNLAQNEKLIKDIENNYSQKNQRLDDAIAAHTSTLNKQMEVSFTMMKEAYEKREAQLKALIGPKAKELDKITEQYQMLEKSNDILNNELQSSAKQLEELYTELQQLKQSKAKLGELPKAMQALQAQNRDLSQQLSETQKLNKNLLKAVKAKNKPDASTSSQREDIIQLRAENQRLRTQLSQQILENSQLRDKLTTASKPAAEPAINPTSLRRGRR